MASVLIKHTVEDYDSWKPVFDDHATTRMEYGSKGYRLLKGSETDDEIVLLFEWDSAENARRFLEESDVKDVMERGGVVGEPEIHFLEEIEAKSAESPMA